MDSFSPCLMHEHTPTSFSLTFSGIEDVMEYLEQHEGQGGGYTWESLVQAALAQRGIEFHDVEFDSEGSMFAAVSPRREPLQTIAGIIRELTSNRQLLDEAITYAKNEGTFE